MDELQSIKQALSFLLDQENIRQQELAALNEKIEALNTILSEKSKEFTGWIDNREFKDFADKYGEKLAPYAEKMGKIHQDYDLVRDTYDAYNSSDMSVDEDEFIDNTVNALDSYLKDIGIPMDVAVEVKADMNGDGEPETTIAEKKPEGEAEVEVKEEIAPEAKTEKDVEAEEDEDKKFMDSINKAVDKELAKNKR